MQLQNDNHQNDPNTDDDSTGSNGMQPMFRPDFPDVAAVREIGSTMYNVTSYDNPSTIVSSNGSTPSNRSGEDMTSPHKIPEVVAALADVDNSNAVASHGKGKNSHPNNHEDNATKPICCLPRWLQRSPLAMKLIIIGVLLVFVTAVVVAVSQYSLIRWNEMNANVNITKTEEPLQPQQNKTSVSKQKSPTSSPKIDSVNNTDFGDDDTVSQNNTAAVTGPSSTPSLVPTSTYTMGPTAASREDTTILYLLSGPYQYVDNSTKPNSSSLSYIADPMSLSRIPTNKGKSFMVQLGDWNSPTNTECSEQTYIDVANYYQNSSIPVYFVLGDNGTFTKL
jgi:hypothetical protein